MTPVCACLQGGIATADRLVTVSPGYSFEIQTAEGGWDLDHLLSSRGMRSCTAQYPTVILDALDTRSLRVMEKEGPEG